MRKNLLLSFGFLFTILPLELSARDLQQISGTHLFLETPSIVKFSDVSGGYAAFVKDEIAINIDASRTGVSLAEVKKQFTSSPPGMKKVEVKNPRYLAFRGELQIGPSWTTNFLLIAGDESDSAMLMIALLKPYDTAKNIQLVQHILDSVEWRPNSDLGFSQLEFFQFPGQNVKYVPTFRYQNNFSYIIKGDTFPKPKSTLTFSKQFFSSDLQGQEKALAEYILKQGNDVAAELEKSIAEFGKIPERNIKLQCTFRDSLGNLKTRYICLVVSSEFCLSDLPVYYWPLRRFCG